MLGLMSPAILQRINCSLLQSLIALARDAFTERIVALLRWCSSARLSDDDCDHTLHFSADLSLRLGSGHPDIKVCPPTPSIRCLYVAELFVLDVNFSRAPNCASCRYNVGVGGYRRGTRQHRSHEQSSAAWWHCQSVSDHRWSQTVRRLHCRFERL